MISAARLQHVPDTGHVRARPNLSIEVVSPEDTVCDSEEKLQDDESAAIPFIWVINPKARTLTAHRPVQMPARPGETEPVKGKNVLPGFTFLVADLLPRLS